MNQRRFIPHENSNDAAIVFESLFSKAAKRVERYRGFLEDTQINASRVWSLKGRDCCFIGRMVINRCVVVEGAATGIVNINLGANLYGRNFATWTSLYKETVKCVSGASWPMIPQRDVPAIMTSLQVDIVNFPSNWSVHLAVELDGWLCYGENIFQEILDTDYIIDAYFGNIP